VSYRLIDHEPEGRTDKVSAMRGHSVAEARLPLLAQMRSAHGIQPCPSSRATGKHLLGESISHFDPTRTSRHVRFFAACGDQADIQSAKCEWLRFMITRPSHVNLKFVT
jgi:hypothetical protein